MNRPSLSSEKTPTLARARSRRYRERAWVPRGLGKLLGGSGTIGQQVGEPEPGGDVDHLRDPVPGDHPGHLVLGVGSGMGGSFRVDSRAKTAGYHPFDAGHRGRHNRDASLSEIEPGHRRPLP